jgi:hypothetical protein
MTAMVCRLRAASRTGSAVLVLAAVACGGPQEPAEEGENCYRDADCKAGLVCVAPAGTKERTCSSDIGGLVSQVVQPPPDAGMPMDDASTPTDDAGGEPPADGG